MRREIRELDLYDLSRPSPGLMPRWARGAVGGAALAMVAVAAVAARSLWFEDGPATKIDPVWFQNGLAAGLGVAILAAALAHGRTSLFVRLAALLPMIFLGGMLVAWWMWEAIAPRMSYVRDHAPLVSAVSVGAAVAALSAATCLATLVVERTRLEAWIRTCVVITLVQVLLLGLWLPVVSWWWQGREGVAWIWDGGHHRFLLGPTTGLMGAALLPPLALATGFARLVARRPALLQRARGALGSAIGSLLFVALIARLAAAAPGYFVYLNLMHFLAASVLIAAAALAALVGMLWWRGGRARRRIARGGTLVRGVIPGQPEGGGGVVACLELEGWLPGLRPLVDAFEVVTATGRIPIPIGAELAASVPPVSSVLHVGESVAVLRRGERVVIGGLVEPEPGHPFRGAAVLVPGSAGVVVAREGEAGSGFQAAALIAWRPCVAFLAILTAIAIPGLAGALALL